MRRKLLRLTKPDASSLAKTPPVKVRCNPVRPRKNRGWIA